MLGETFGDNIVDAWVLPGTPLIVQRIQNSTTTSQSRIGPVEYHEEYQLRLRSLYPDGGTHR